ncbi:MAG: hypothetical protein IH946_04615 [Bacteroidetes bacterium]|nr:hypothetical protein [Bacteroidota bacterium]
MKATDKAKKESVPSLMDWTHKCWSSEEKQHLCKFAIDVCRVVVGELKTPDVESPEEDDFHIAVTNGNTSDGTLNSLTNSSFLCYVRSPMIREDRIYKQFPGEEKDVREVLGNLGLCWLVRGLFEPSHSLHTAFTHAVQTAEKNQKKKPNPLLTLSPHGACFVLAQGDFRAAALLYQIRYWHEKARVWLGGHRWIAKAAVVWAAETAMSLSQYHRALRKLKDLRIIETKQYPFGSKNLTHLRPITYVALGPLAIEFENGAWHLS